MKDHKRKMSEIFREMVEDKKVPLTPSISKGNFLYLQRSPYCHPYGIEKCVPEHRSCVYCWHYWCGNCGTGLGGMYGICNYEFCMTGYKNKLNY